MQALKRVQQLGGGALGSTGSRKRESRAACVPVTATRSQAYPTLPHAHASTHAHMEGGGGTSGKSTRLHLSLHHQDGVDTRRLSYARQDGVDSNAFEATVHAIVYSTEVQGHGHPQHTGQLALTRAYDRQTDTQTHRHTTRYCMHAQNTHLQRLSDVHVRKTVQVTLPGVMCLQAVCTYQGGYFMLPGQDQHKLAAPSWRSIWLLMRRLGNPTSCLVWPSKPQIVRARRSVRVC